MDNLRMDLKSKKGQAKSDKVLLKADSESGREAYAAPELIEYGSLTDVTQFGGSGSSDFLGMQTGTGN